MTDAETVKRILERDGGAPERRLRMMEGQYEPALNAAQLAKAAELARKKVTETLNDYQTRQWCLEVAVKQAGATEGGIDTVKRAEAFYEFIMRSVWEWKPDVRS